jgi:hypothetical protein
MANTTFSGPVRSQNGFETISVNSSLTAAANAGRINIVPNGTQDNTYTLPTPVAGLMFTFVYGGGAADATDFIINTGSNTNYFIGGVAFNDTDDGAASVVFSDGNSNSKLQVNVPAAAQINVLAINGTNWQVWGSVTGATAPAFADQ